MLKIINKLLNKEEITEEKHENLFGIDVSAHQGKIDWEKIKNSGCKYAIIRCGYGNDIEKQDDSMYKYNVTECERLKIPYGIYIYSYANNDEFLQSEIKHTIRLIKGYNPFCVYFDMEDNSTVKLGKEKLTEYAITWCESIKNEGFNVGIYANQNWFQNYLDVKKLYSKGYSIWAAKYSKNEPNINVPFDIWQYSSNGKIEGIAGRVDTNYLYNETLLTKETESGVSDNDSGEKEEQVIPPSQPSVPDSTPTPSPITNTKVNVYYRVRTDGRWLPEVCNLDDYAGIEGKAITDVAIRVDKGSIKYRVHTGGRWLDYVTGCNINDSKNGYAGCKQNIDAIEIYYNTPDNIRPYKYANYRVSPTNKTNYFSWQIDNKKTDNMDGYAGLFGRSLDKLQIEIK